MKRILAVLALAALLTSLPTLAQGPPISPTREADPNAPKDPIVAQELNLWRAYGKRDFDALRTLLLPDYLAVEDGIRTRDQTLAFLPTCTLNKFGLDEPKVRNLTPDSAVIAYHSTYTLTCNNAEIRGNANATTVWVRRNNQWLAQLHTATPTTSSK